MTAVAAAYDEPLLPRATRFIRETDHTHYKRVRTVIRAGVAGLRSGKAVPADAASTNLTASTRWGNVWITFGRQMTVTLISRNGTQPPQFTVDAVPAGHFDMSDPMGAASILEAALAAYDACELVDGSLNDLRRDSAGGSMLDQIEACYQAIGGSYPASITLQPPGPYLYPALYVTATLNREWLSTLELAETLAATIPPSAQFVLQVSTPGMENPRLQDVRLTARRKSSIRLERPLEPIELLRRLKAYGADPANALTKAY